MTTLKEIIEGAETLDEIVERVRAAGGIVHLDRGGASETCSCRCPDGPCEHRWDGDPAEFDDGRGWTSTCSRCGMWAINHGMRVAP